MIEGYSPPVYQQNRIVEGFRNLPRFGHSDDISKLFSVESSDHADYTLGAIFIGVLLLSIFLIWVVILLIFTFVGKDKVGFLSGYAMLKSHYTKGPSMTRSPSIKWFCDTATIVRLIFVFSSMVVVTISILSTFMIGFHDLKSSIDGISGNALEIRNLSHEGKVILNSMKSYGDYSKTLRDIILPDLRYPKFCFNTALDTLTELPLNATRQEVVDDLVTLGDFQTDQLEYFRDTVFSELQTRSANTWKFFDRYGIHVWQVYSFGISYGIIASFMMITTISTWAGRPISFFICTSTWFLLPIFIVLVTVSWLITSALGVVAVMNADFCTGGSLLEGPDLTVRYMLERSRLVEKSELLYDAAVYWFDGCKSESPFSEFDIYQTLLNNSMTSMNNLQNMMENATIFQLEQICGVVGDFDSIELYFDRLSENFVQLGSTASQFALMTSCETINSLYVDAVHDNVCTEFPRALLWTFVTLLIVSIYGMIMITLRSAWLEFREKRTRLIDDLPVISIEKIQDLNDEQFNDSPSPKYDNNQRDGDECDGEDSSSFSEPSPLTGSEGKDNLEIEVLSLSNDERDPVSIYQTISVADEGLQDIPTSPTDPPNYRVY